MLGWSYYGEIALNWLVGEWKIKSAWRVVFLAVTVVGSVCEVEAVWRLVDLFTALMALPNLAALLVLSPQVLKIWREYKKASV